MAADRLRETFSIDVHVGRGTEGDRFVIPLRRSR
jgi:hypothetical protein